MGFCDLRVTVSSPGSTNPEYTCGQNVVEANVVTADGDGGDVSDGRIGPVGCRSQFLLSGVSVEEILTMRRLGYMLLR